MKKAIIFKGMCEASFRPLHDDIDEASADHRLTLRIPIWLMNKIDDKCKERVGKISRNLWILEVLEKAV